MRRVKCQDTGEWKLDDIYNVLKNNGIQLSLEEYKLATIKEMSIFYNISYETLKRKINRNKDVLHNNVKILKSNNKIMKELKNKHVISNKTTIITIIDLIGIIKCAYITSGEKQTQIKNDIRKLFPKIHEKMCTLFSDLTYIKKYQDEMAYIIDNVFINHHVEHEKYVNGYRIDFLIDNFLAIECDENNHDYYNKDKENKREQIIKECGYKIIRYNTKCNNMLAFIGVNNPGGVEPAVRCK